MERFLGRFSKYIYAILRVVAGLMFMMHGTQKLLGFPGNTPPIAIGSFMGFAGVLELVCGLLIALGLFTSFAAFIASGEMAAAYFMAHYPKSFWPILNSGELATLYCFLFLYIAATGPGIWSLDSSFRKRRVT